MRRVALVLLLGACSLDTSTLSSTGASDAAAGVDAAATDAGRTLDAGPRQDARAPDAGCVDGTECDDTTLLTCAAGVVSRTICGDLGAYCGVDPGMESACIPQVCEPGGLRCSGDGMSTLQCDRVGSSEVAVPCSFGCDTGTGDCSPAPTCPFPDVTDISEGEMDFNLCDYRNDHGNRRSPACPWNGADGWDRVFRMVLTTRQSITIELRDADRNRYIDTNLYIRTSCDVASSQIACADDVPAVTRSAITTTLDAGTYYVFADSWDSFGGRCGNVRLTFRR